MPSLKMKRKLTTGYVREKNGLHVCQQSYVISKSSCSHVQISEEAAEFDAGIQNSQCGSMYRKVHIQETGDDKGFGCHKLLIEENLQTQENLSPLTNFSTPGEMEATTLTSVSNLETIFSPALESIEVCSEQEGNNDSGINKDLNAPHFGADDRDDEIKSTCAYQACNVSDFYISDMIIAGLPIEGNSVYNDIVDTTLPDYKFCEPSTLFKVAEECMTLPFLEDALEACSDHDTRTFEDTCSDHDTRTFEDILMDSDDSSLYLAIHQLRSCNEEPDLNPYSESNQLDHFDPHIFIRNLPDLPDVVPNFEPTSLSSGTLKLKSITLVLDLDETLVHSTLEPCEDADFTFSVFFNLKEHKVYVKKRPYLQMFLERVAEMFEIVIFTASQSIYAKQLLDILDPEGKFISRRAYRESCIFSDGSYTKDLTVLGVDLAKIAIIDNSPQVFQLQVNNGIPIKSWFDDPSDCALISLLPFLETLADADDVRPIVAKRFGNKE